LRDQPGGFDLKMILVHARVEQLGIEATDGVNHRGEDGHRVGVAGEALEVVLQVLVQEFILREQVGEAFKLGAVRELAHDEQVGDFNEGGLLGEFLDGDAAVAQDAQIAVDEGDLALARAGVSVAFVERDVAGLGAELGNVHGALAFGADEGGEGVSFSVEFEFRVAAHKYCGGATKPGRDYRPLK
jgi:hypothetical protein